ncbi:MAG: hypothetical protein ACK4HW_04985 [Roseinatronobacter sp.]
MRTLPQIALPDNARSLLSELELLLNRLPLAQVVFQDITGQVTLRHETSESVFIGPSLQDIDFVDHVFGQAASSPKFSLAMNSGRARS